MLCVCVCSVMSDSLWSMAYSPAGSSVHRISQARILEWVAISFSRGTSQPRDRTHISCISFIADELFTSEPPGKPYGIVEGLEKSVFQQKWISWKHQSLNILQDGKHCKNLWATGFFIPIERTNEEELISFNRINPYSNNFSGMMFSIYLANLLDFQNDVCSL